MTKSESPKHVDVIFRLLYTTLNEFTTIHYYVLNVNTCKHTNLCQPGSLCTWQHLQARLPAPRQLCTGVYVRFVLACVCTVPMWCRLSNSILAYIFSDAVNAKILRPRPRPQPSTLYLQAQGLHLQAHGHRSRGERPLCITAARAEIKIHSASDSLTV